jgi:hypothetical protein
MGILLFEVNNGKIFLAWSWSKAFMESIVIRTNFTRKKVIKKA